MLIIIVMGVSLSNTELIKQKMQIQRPVFKGSFECVLPFSISAKISGWSHWSRSTMWSLHTEDTRLISRGTIFDDFDHDTSMPQTNLLNFAAFTVSKTLNLA